jgi:hypothetical protein
MFETVERKWTLREWWGIGLGLHRTISRCELALQRFGLVLLNTSRFPVRNPDAMSLTHKIGNLILSLATSLLYLHWVRDSQSGMWVFRRSILEHFRLTADGMALS